MYVQSRTVIYVFKQLKFFETHLSVFAMLGMLSPASRGALMTAAIFLYVCLGVVAGYFSARIYKTLKGREWKRAAFLVDIGKRVKSPNRFKSNLSNGFLLGISDGYSIPERRVLHLFFSQFFYLGEAFVRSRSVSDDGLFVVSLVRNLFSFGLRRQLFRLQKSPVSASSKNESNSQTGQEKRNRFSQKRNKIN